MIVKIMQKQEKRNSEILNKLRSKRDFQETKRTRISMLLAARISRAIKDRNWSKIEFAGKIGKSPSVISKWLSGTHNFTSDTISDIQEALSIQLFNLEKEEDRPIISAGTTTNITVNIFKKIDDYSKAFDGEGIFFEVAADVQVVETTLPNLN